MKIIYGLAYLAGFMALGSAILLGGGAILLSAFGEDRLKSLFSAGTSLGLIALLISLAVRCIAGAVLCIGDIMLRFTKKRDGVEHV